MSLFDEFHTACETPVCSVLYIYLNPIMYNTLYKIQITDASAELMNYELIISEVIKSIRHVIDVVKPTKSVYISMDGPVSNMALKKRRERLASSESNGMDFTLFLPGTLFMCTLNRRLQSLTNLQLITPSVVLSDSTQIGEGDVKIMRHIRHYKPSQVVVWNIESVLINLCTCVYSPDVIICKQSKNGIVFTQASTTFDAFLKHNQLATDTQVRCDVMLLCMLMGNDFVPFKMHQEKWWNAIIEAYKQYNSNLIKTSHMAIDFTSLLSLLRGLSYLGAPCDEFSETNCDEYLMSIQWCWDYFTHGLVDWRLTCTCSHPMFGRLPHEWKRPTPTVQPKGPLTPLAQLIYMLPPSHVNILPNCMQHIDSSMSLHEAQSLCDQLITQCSSSERDRNIMENMDLNCIYASSG